MNEYGYVVKPYSIANLQNVVIQVQPIRYQSQPGHCPQFTILWTIDPTTTGRDLGSF